MMQRKIEQARFNMIEQQIKPWNVSDSKVLNAMRHIRREDFVPIEFKEMAFADMAIPLDNGVMLEPKLVARMLQSLDVGDSDRVLVVGVGTGYVPALISQYAHSVICIAPSKVIIEGAKCKLAMVGISNVQFQHGDASHGWPGCGEIDRIFVRNSLSAMPSELCQQLSQDGRCVAVVGAGNMMELMLYRRKGGEIISDSVLDTVISRPSENNSKPEFIF